MAQAPAVMPGNTLNGMTTVTQFPLKSLVLVVSTLLAGCSTDPAFFDAEAQRHQSAQAPIFECQKCEGVTLRSQIPSAPTVAPTNGWDALSSVGKSASNLIAGQGGAILAGYAINALSSSKPAASPTPVIVNPTTTTTTTTTGDTISTYSADQRTESTVTTSSTSNALQNSGQMAGGDASVENSHNPHTETATSTTSNSNNPITTNPQNGTAP